MRVSGSIHITGDVEGERVFTTYNKSESKPLKPTGNGEGGGWSASNEDGAIWMSVKTATDISEGEWGEVIKIKGDKGERGYQGPIPYPAGEWSSTVTYTRTTEKVPYVVHDGLYYYLGKEGSFMGGANPHDDYAANGSNATWILIENLQWLFVEILLAQWAKLGSAIFTDNKLISQKGKLNGVDSYDYTEDGFIPNISFNFYDGSGHLAAGNISWDAAGNTEFKGKIDAISGSIGGFEIGSGRIGMEEDECSGRYDGLSLYGGFIKFSESKIDEKASFEQGTQVKYTSKWVGIGNNVLPAFYGFAGIARFENLEKHVYKQENTYYDYYYTEQDWINAGSPQPAEFVYETAYPYELQYIRVTVTYYTWPYLPGSLNYGVMIDVEGAETNIALDILSGDLKTRKGSFSLQSNKYKGEAFTDSIILHINETNIFLFSYVPAYRTVYLPTRYQIDNGDKSSTMLLLFITIGYSAANKIALTSVTNGQMRNWNGDVVNSIDMGKGDSCILLYNDGIYHIINIQK